MAEDGMIGNGVKIAYSAASPVSWLGIGQVLECAGLGIERDKVDRTVSSALIYKRSLPGMAEVRPLELTILADPDEGSADQGVRQKALRDYVVSGTTIWFRIEVPVDRTQSAFKPFEYQGYVRSWEMATPIENRITFQIIVEYDSDSFTEYDAGASAIS